MTKLFYTPQFIRKYRKLPLALQEEAKEKISIFTKDQNHPFLKTHKLKGVLKGFWSFSVNYDYRIVFTYDTKNVIALLSIGNHDTYKTK
jgi:addiction module RelE/StbE family toxin